MEMGRCNAVFFIHRNAQQSKHLHNMLVKISRPDVVHMKSLTEKKYYWQHRVSAVASHS